MNLEAKMSVMWGVGALALCAVAPAPAALIGTLPGGTDSQVAIIDQTSGAASVIGSTGFPKIVGIAVRPSDGTVFGSTGQLIPVDLGTIIVIDPVTGAGTEVGPSAESPNGPIRDLAFGPGGVLYAACNRYDLGEDLADSICTIDQTTGESTVGKRVQYPAGTTLAGIEAIEFAPGGELYAATGSVYPGGAILFSVNLATGVATKIGDIRDSGDVPLGAGVVGMEFVGSLLFASTDDGQIVTIDTASGVYTAVGDIGISGAVHGLASASVATPTPTETGTPVPTSTPSPGPCNQSAPANPCVPGGGSVVSDCQTEWLLQAVPPLKNNIPSNRLVCYEGDGECDRDADLDNESCTIAVALCINNTDPRIGACSPLDIASFEVRKPNPNRLRDGADAANLAALEARAGAGGLGVTVVRGDSVTFSGVSQNRRDVCTGDASILVPLRRKTSGAVSKGKRTLRVRASTSLRRVDSDVLRLECRPSTCGNGTREDHEECEDGNRDGGDGCDPGCRIEELPTPTPVPSGTPTATPAGGSPIPTRTPTATGTASATRTETASPTITPTPTPSPSPSPTMAGLGLRVFSILPKPASAFFSTALSGSDVSGTDWSSGPLRLVAGEADANGVSPLWLQQDVIFGFKVMDNSVVCVKLEAAGSGGSVDCDGGTAYDVTLTQDSHGTGAADPPVLTAGLGSDGGPGAAMLTVMSVMTNLPSSASVASCQTAAFAATQLAAYTTRTATATVLNARQGGTKTLTKTGVNFSCASWTTENSAGTLVNPNIGLDTIVGDSAQALQVKD